MMDDSIDKLEMAIDALLAENDQLLKELKELRENFESLKKDCLELEMELGLAYTTIEHDRGLEFGSYSRRNEDENV